MRRTSATCSSTRSGAGWWRSSAPCRPRAWPTRRNDRACSGHLASLASLVRFVALATDYDETLADGGRVAERAAAALEKVRASGRRLVLVTGRELPDLRRVFPRVGELFDAVVAENGAVLWITAAREE